MKKSLLAGLLLAISLVGLAQAADSYGRVTQTSSTGILFYLREGAANGLAVTYTPTSLVGPGVVVTKLIVSGYTAATTITASLWDAPNGITGAAGAREVVQINASLSAPYIFDLTSSKGARQDTDGIYFKYYPTLVTGTIATDYTLMYQPAGASPLRPLP